MTLLSTALTPLRRLFSNRDPATRLIVLVGLGLVGSGLAHVLVWLAAGLPSLAGPVSWRKPIVFGLSGGVTSLSVAWVVSHLPASARRLRWSRIFAITMALEVLLIDIQRWRGVGSHFNLSTLLDGVIFNLMGVIVLTSIAAMAVLGRDLRRSKAPDDIRVAGWFSILIALGGSAVGGAMAAYGSYVVMRGGHFEGVPQAMKAAHAIPLHALQVLPALAWFFRERGLDAASRASAMVRASVGYALVFAATLLLALGAGAAVSAAIGGVGAGLFISTLTAPVRRAVVA